MFWMPLIEGNDRLPKKRPRIALLKKGMLAVVFLLMLPLLGCSSLRSDQEWSTLPGTNNPHLIIDSQRSAIPGGFGH